MLVAAESSWLQCSIVAGPSHSFKDSPLSLRVSVIAMSDEKPQVHWDAADKVMCRGSSVCLGCSRYGAHVCWMIKDDPLLVSRVLDSKQLFCDRRSAGRC